MENNANKPAVPPKRKLTRHFWLFPLLIGFGLILAGQLLGLVITVPFRRIMNLSDMWLFTVDYGSTIGVVIVVMIYCFFFEKPTFQGFKPARKGGLKGNNIKEFALGLVIGFIMNGGCILVAWLHGDLHFSLNTFHPVYLIVTFLCVCCQSSSEEMVTRGYIYHAHIERYPAWFAILANSLFFGAIHLMNTGITVIAFLQISICGIALSLIVYARKSLWMAYAIHTMWNYTQSILFGLPNSGIVSKGSLLNLDAASESFWYDPVFGIEGTLLSVVMETALCVWCLCLIWKQRKAGKTQSA